MLTESRALLKHLEDFSFDRSTRVGNPVRRNSSTEVLGVLLVMCTGGGGLVGFFVYRFFTLFCVVVVGAMNKGGCLRIYFYCLLANWNVLVVKFGVVAICHLQETLKI